VPGDADAAPVRGEGRALAAGSLTGAAWTLVSRVTGFVRVAGVAAVLGPTYLGNTFQAANLLPNLAFYLFTGALVTALVVPPMARAFADPDADPERLGRSICTAVVAVLTGVALLLAALAPLLARLLSAAVDDPEIASAQHRAGALLLITLAPQVPLYGLGAVAGAVQIAKGRFALPHGAPALENIGILITLGIWLARFGPGGDVRTVSAAQLVLLGLGTTASVALHAVAQWIGARRAGITLFPTRVDRHDPEIAALGGRAKASVGIAAAQAGRELALLVVAGARAGAVVAFQVAYAFYNLVIAVGARTVAAAALPKLSEEATGERYRRALGLALAVALPAAVAFLVVGDDLARAAAYGEMSRPGGAALIAAALAGLAVGVAADSALTVSTATAYAADRTSSVLKATLVRAGVTAAGAVAVLVIEPAPTAAFVAALGLAVSAGDLAGGAGLHLDLARRVRGGSLTRRLTISSLAAIVMAAPAWLAASGLSNSSSAGAGRALPAAAAALVGGLVVVAVHVVLRSPVIADLRD
jgi:putative peptidoglycan lipid II flippase